MEGLSVDDEAGDALGVVGDDVGRPLLLAGKGPGPVLRFKCPL